MVGILEFYKKTLDIRGVVMYLSLSATGLIMLICRLII